MTKWKQLTRSTRCCLVTGGIVVVGWSIALALYLAAAIVPEDDEVYEMEHSKAYLRKIEEMGGQAGVLTAQLNDWIAGLWRGRSLAYTIACLTTIVALFYYLLQHHVQPRDTPPSGQ